MHSDNQGKHFWIQETKGRLRNGNLSETPSNLSNKIQSEYLSKDVDLYTHFLYNIYLCVHM